MDMKKVLAIPKYTFDERYSNEAFTNNKNIGFTSILDEER